MPKNNSINHILIIGSGPIVIGQACEFDYSGSQASRSLRDEGIEVTLINSNPATIMTDPVVADNIYLKPLTVESIEEIEAVLIKLDVRAGDKIKLTVVRENDLLDVSLTLGEVWKKEV